MPKPRFSDGTARFASVPSGDSRLGYKLIDSHPSQDQAVVLSGCVSSSALGSLNHGFWPYSHVVLSSVGYGFCFCSSFVVEVATAQSFHYSMKPRYPMRKTVISYLMEEKEGMCEDTA